MMHHYPGLPRDGRCWYGQKRLKCHDDQLYIARCKKIPEQMFLFVYLSGGEVLIKLGNGQDRCLERKNRDIYLRPCNQHNDKQRWYAPNGNFRSSRFEVSQRGYMGQCMTQDHHPKPGMKTAMGVFYFLLNFTIAYY